MFYLNQFMLCFVCSLFTMMKHLDLSHVPNLNDRYQAAEVKVIMYRFKNTSKPNWLLFKCH